MIRSLLLLALTLALPVWAQAEGAPQPTPESPPSAEDDQSLERWRTPVEALTERMIGSASKSVRFDWRKSPIAFALIGTELLERNNFGSTRLGLMARRPFGAFMGEVALSRAFSWSTQSSDTLALTPYRQYGRPSRFELDINLGYPVAEGVVTALPSIVPPAELVFSGIVGLRYLFYPGSLDEAPFLETAGTIISPRLSAREFENLEAQRLPGMQIDSARYGLLAGLNLDIYFQPGAFITPRVMIAVPLLTPINGTNLGLWWELNLGLGWAL